jgi:hypothetical protein
MLSARSEDEERPRKTPERRNKSSDKHLADAIAQLQTVPHHLVEGKLVANTKDNEDHTFSGIMFEVEAKDDLPIKFLEIQSVSVRGELGMVSVYVDMKCVIRNYTISIRRGRASPSSEDWERRFGPKLMEESFNKLVEIPLSPPIRIAPGQSFGIYIHSELPNDTAIVYDNLRSGTGVTYDDSFIKIHPGIAHTSNVAFAQTNVWGGNAWRPSREFVGSVRYGIKFLMWTPVVHERFSDEFRTGVFTLICSQNVLGKQKGVNLGKLPIEVVMKIVNMLPHDWFSVSTKEEGDEENSDFDDDVEESENDD